MAVLSCTVIGRVDIIENPGNTRGAKQPFGRWLADGLYVVNATYYAN